MKYWEFKNQYEIYLDKLRINESVRTWHCKPEGSKGNDAFIITRNKSGYAYYCHHCGERGMYSSSRRHLRSPVSDLKGSSNTQVQGKAGKPVKMPSDSETDMSKWPSKFRVWIWKYSITNEEVNNYGIAYSSWFDRLIFPVRDSAGKLISWTARSLDKEPKYIFRGSRLDGVWHSNNYPTDFSSVTLVEDIISGIKCGRIMDSVALLGTTLPEASLNSVVRYKKVYIALDNDNRIVMQKQLNLLKRLELYTDVKIVHLDKDPKDCSESYLRKILT